MFVYRGSSRNWLNFHQDMPTTVLTDVEQENIERVDTTSMKIKLTLIACSLALLAGCTSTNFVEHRGSSIVQGRGGSCRNIKGIDFWEIGEPNCTYEVIGYIQQESVYDSGDFLERAIAKSGSKSAIAAEAKKRGGDGVILVSSSNEVIGGHSSGTAFTSGSSYTVGGSSTSGSYATYGTSYTHNQVLNAKQLVVVRYVK